MIVVTLFSASAFAQKASVKKVQHMLDYAEPAIQIDLSNLEPKKLEEMKTIIEAAITNPETAEDFRTWGYYGRLQVYEKNEILKAYTANGNNFVDKEHMKRFFQNEADIVSVYEKYFKLLTTPNDKGKLPLKDEELNKEKVLAQTIAAPSRANLYVAATQFVYDDPEYAVNLLKKYYESFDEPIFADMDLKNTDPNYAESAYVYATALKGAKADPAKIEELLIKSLETKSGPLACQDLITYYHEKGDVAKENEYLKYAYEKFPTYLVFGVNLAQNTLQEKKYDETIQICDELIKRMESGQIPETDDAGNPMPKDNNWYPYYFKAVSYFNTEKYDKAYEAFSAGDDAWPDHLEMVMGAGTAAAKYGNDHFADKPICKPWFEKAIKYFKKAELGWPDQPDQWGYQLYACYHNLEDKVNEAKYKKFVK